MSNILILILYVCCRLVHLRPELELLGKRWEASGKTCDLYRTCDFNKDRDVPLCYCDSACMFYKDCCDFGTNSSLPEWANLQEDTEKYRRMNKSKCTFNHQNEIVGARVVSTCRNHEEKCFQSKNTTELNDVIFVTGSDGITYQNRFCAVCNGIEEFTVWSLSITFNIPFLDATGYDICNVSVYENLKNTSSYEKGNFLIKRCTYKLLQPLGTKPRLCVRDKYKCSLTFMDDHPFHESSTLGPFSLNVLFNFDLNAKHDMLQSGHADSKDTSKVQEMNTRLSVKNLLLIHKLSMSCNCTLDLDQLHMLLNSLSQYFEVALSGMKPDHPFFIDYMIYDLNIVRIDVKTYLVAAEYLQHSKVDLTRKWLNHFKVKYKVLVYDSSSETEEILYKVDSISTIINPGCFNCSHAKLRFYPNYMVVDKGFEMFGKHRTFYGNDKTIERVTAFPAVLCDELAISLTFLQDKASVVGSCLKEGEGNMSGGRNTSKPAGRYHVISLYCIVSYLLHSLMK